MIECALTLMFVREWMIMVRALALGVIVPWALAYLALELVVFLLLKVGIARTGCRLYPRLELLNGKAASGTRSTDTHPCAYILWIRTLRTECGLLRKFQDCSLTKFLYIYVLTWELCLNVRQNEWCRWRWYMGVIGSSLANQSPLFEKATCRRS